MNDAFPNEQESKARSEGYRFCFKLDLDSRPTGLRISDLVEAAPYNKNYTAFTTLTRPKHVKLYGYDDSGDRTNYLGYKFCDWLQIEPSHVVQGRVNLDCVMHSIRIFEVEFYNIYEIYKLDINKNISYSDCLRKEVYKVSDSETNKFIQSILKEEVTLFLNECGKMMSPK